VFVLVITENRFLLDSSYDDVMQGVRSIYACFSWHIWLLVEKGENVNISRTSPIWDFDLMGFHGVGAFLP
jgi:hypothetical protein